MVSIFPPVVLVGQRDADGKPAVTYGACVPTRGAYHLYEYHTWQ